VRENLTLVVALSPDRYSGRDKQSHIRRRKRGLDLFRRVVLQGIETGEFRAVPPDLASEALYGTVTGLVDSMAYGDEFPKPEELVPTLMQIFLQGLKSETTGTANGAVRPRGASAGRGERR